MGQAGAEQRTRAGEWPWRNDGWRLRCVGRRTDVEPTGGGGDTVVTTGLATTMERGASGVACEFTSPPHRSNVQRHVAQAA